VFFSNHQNRGRASIIRRGVLHPCSIQKERNGYDNYEHAREHQGQAHSLEEREAFPVKSSLVRLSDTGQADVCQSRWTHFYQHYHALSNEDSRPMAHQGCILLWACCIVTSNERTATRTFSAGISRGRHGMSRFSRSRLCIDCSGKSSPVTSTSVFHFLSGCTSLYVA
jgi:hypothetical protein